MEKVKARRKPRPSFLKEESHKTIVVQVPERLYPAFQRHCFAEGGTPSGKARSILTRYMEEVFEKEGPSDVGRTSNA